MTIFIIVLTAEILLFSIGYAAYRKNRRSELPGGKFPEG